MFPLEEGFGELPADSFGGSWAGCALRALWFPIVKMAK